MTRMIAALGAGLVFGLGLGLSDMVNPARVLAFLDVTGNWDPTLVYVMGGGLLIGLIAFRPTVARGRPLLALRFDLPGRQGIDGRLIGGAALFGVGWGLAGYCPGPAIGSVVLGNPKTLAFLAAMAAGMVLHGLLQRPRADTPVPA